MWQYYNRGANVSTILEDIFKKNNNDNKVFNLNNTFFKSFMNASSIIKLIDIRI